MKNCGIKKIKEINKMKFLLQTKNKKIIFDGQFTLLESLNFMNWLSRSNDYKVTYTDKLLYKKSWTKCIPVGSVEFVSDFLYLYHGKDVKPINVPEELIKFANRNIINGTEKDIIGEKFVKSNDKIKTFTNICTEAPVGNYQISDLIDIDSEYRCFVYNKELVGVKHYSGDFTMFPDIIKIKEMISEYKSAPIAYTLDIGINKDGVFVIEVHDFFACGLYGFQEHKTYIQMLSRWFYEYIKKTLRLY